MPDGRIAAWSAFAGSLATLLCCALPSLLVLLGLGTTVAAVVSNAPWLVAISRSKEWVFTAAALLIASSRLYLRWIVPRVAATGAACPHYLSRATRTAWWTSVLLYSLAFFVAFLLGPILTWLER
jgi:hypothetical protein